MSNKPIITDRQRASQALSMKSAKSILDVAILEMETATPDEIAQTLDVVLENLAKVKTFLATRAQHST